jgi:hypothetical protein
MMKWIVVNQNRHGMVHTTSHFVKLVLIELLFYTYCKHLIILMLAYLDVYSAKIQSKKQHEKHDL